MAPAFGLLLLLVPGALAATGLVLLVLGLLGRAVLDDPRCVACGYDLTQPTRRPTRCPECGADLAAPASVRFARRRRSPAMMALGAALIVVAVLGPVALLVAVRYARTVRTANTVAAAPLPALPVNASAMTTSSLLERLSAGPQHEHAHELSERLDAGRLAPAETQRLAEVLCETLESGAGGDPRHGSLTPLLWSQRLADLLDGPDLPPPLAARLALAAAGPHPIELPARVRAGTALRIGLRPQFDPGIRSIASIVAIRVDGAPVDLLRDPSQRPSESARIQLDDPGTRVVEIDLDRVVGAFAVEGPGSRDPAERGRAILATQTDDPRELRRHGAYARQRTTIRHPIEVRPVGVPLIDPLVDPSKADALRDAIVVRRARIDAGAEPGRAILDLLLSVELPFDAALAVRPVVLLGASEQPLGSFAVVRRDGATSSFQSSRWRVPIEAPDPSVRDIAIRLEPCLGAEAGPLDILVPMLLAGRNPILEAWGDPILLEGIELRRVDLELDAAAPAPERADD